MVAKIAVLVVLPSRLSASRKLGAELPMFNRNSDARAKRGCSPI